jgi:hypothetical protein
MPYPNAGQPVYTQPVYTQPVYTQPAYTQPPSDAYGRPFAAPYATPPVAGYQPRQPTPAGPSALGAVAFILSLLAAVGAPIVVSFAAWGIGTGLGSQEFTTLTENSPSTSVLLAALTPVRGQVLAAEIAFWAGTILGIWAIIQGIVAIAKRRGRGFGIAAIVVAVIGPFVFFWLAVIFLGMGAAGAVPPNA